MMNQYLPYIAVGSAWQEYNKKTLQSKCKSFRTVQELKPISYSSFKNNETSP